MSLCVKSIWPSLGPFQVLIYPCSRTCILNLRHEGECENEKEELKQHVFAKWDVTQTVFIQHHHQWKAVLYPINHSKHLRWLHAQKHISTCQSDIWYKAAINTFTIRTSPHTKRRRTCLYSQMPIMTSLCLGNRQGGKYHNVYHALAFRHLNGQEHLRWRERLWMVWRLTYRAREIWFKTLFNKHFNLCKTERPIKRNLKFI